MRARFSSSTLPSARRARVDMEVVGDTLVYVGGYVFLVFMAVCLATGARETKRRDARARETIVRTSGREGCRARWTRCSARVRLTRRCGMMGACVARAGLYYLAEMVEEYTRLTKKVLDWSIKTTYVLHALLWIVDRKPFFTVLVSAGAQFAYSQMLRRFPFIVFTSAEFLTSLAALGATHWVWVRFFHGTYHSTEYVLGFFFMIVWFVPFGFFISIAANESVLPGGATVPGAPNGANLGGYDPNRGGKKTRNALLMLLDTLKVYWTRLTEKFMPAGGIPGTYRDPGHMKGW